MLPSKLAFVDIETTGMHSLYDRVIEIGILRVEDNKITKSFHSLIDPQTRFAPEITQLTGITQQDLEKAPTFRQIQTDILDILNDCIFIAHNVRFDYSFLKNEFLRRDISFSSKHFCTVRLSRLLYPQFLHHNLDSLIERHGFTCVKRHRALDDAKVLVSFYNKILQDFPLEHVENAVKKALKKPSLPLKIPHAEIDTLPEQPGVYIFYSENGIPLYIGKSKNIRDRVLSHFASDIHSSTEMKISQQIEHIETIPTAGELGALFLESELIKKLLPLYNKKSRVKHELIALKSKLNKNGYRECFLEAITIIDPTMLDSFLGFFRSRKQAKSFLADIVKKYSLCEKLLGLESTGLSRSKNGCFANRLGRCKGACIGTEKPIVHNLKFITAFASSKIKPWPFPGQIIIEESDVHKKEYILINKWCYLGNVKIEQEDTNINNPSNQSLAELFNNGAIEQWGNDYTFDLDIYKIIKQYLSQPQNYKKVRILNSDQITSTETLSANWLTQPQLKKETLNQV